MWSCFLFSNRGEGWQRGGCLGKVRPQLCRGNGSEEGSGEGSRNGWRTCCHTEMEVSGMLLVVCLKWMAIYPTRSPLGKAVVTGGRRWWAA